MSVLYFLLDYTELKMECPEWVGEALYRGLKRCLIFFFFSYSIITVFDFFVFLLFFYYYGELSNSNWNVLLYTVPTFLSLLTVELTLEIIL